MKTRFIIPLIAFALMVGLFWVGLKLDPQKVPSVLIDKPAPEFSLPSLMREGEIIDKAVLQKNKVTLFNVWASWCVACRQEHPLLVEISRQGLVPIYGLNYKDKVEDAKKWLDYFGNPYVDSASDLKGRVGIDYGVYGVPETFVIDSKGTIRYKEIGPISEQSWSEIIWPLIQQIRAEKG